MLFMFSAKTVKKYSNGDVYIGFMRNGQPDGKGKKIFADGRIIDGGWKNGMRHGFVRLTASDGNSVDNFFEDDFIAAVPTSGHPFPTASHDQKEKARERFKHTEHKVIIQQRWNAMVGRNDFKRYNGASVLAPNKTTPATAQIQNEKVVVGPLSSTIHSRGFNVPMLYLVREFAQLMNRYKRQQLVVNDALMRAVHEFYRSFQRGPDRHARPGPALSDHGPFESPLYNFLFDYQF